MGQVREGDPISLQTYILPMADFRLYAQVLPETMPADISPRLVPAFIFSSW